SNKMCVDTAPQGCGTLRLPARVPFKTHAVLRLLVRRPQRLLCCLTCASAAAVLMKCGWAATPLWLKMKAWPPTRYRIYGRRQQASLARPTLKYERLEQTWTRRIRRSPDFRLRAEVPVVAAS